MSINSIPIGNTPSRRRGDHASLAPPTTKTRRRRRRMRPTPATSRGREPGARIQTVNAYPRPSAHHLLRTPFPSRPCAARLGGTERGGRGHICTVIVFFPPPFVRFARMFV